ncbi:MAG: TldD/PmbA family protein [Alphaproteobacteria bacterium]|nr:TldD/PmbA family protein [Alphaproteobacteria bacterium]
MSSEVAATQNYDENSLRNIAEDVIARVRKAGADAADVLMVAGASLSASCRMGEVEEVERSDGQEFGLRAFVGRRQAIVSSSDFSKASLDQLITRVVSMARRAPEDKYCGLADPDLLAKTFPDLDISDDTAPDMPSLISAAKRAEDAARAVQGITNSEGAGASSSHSRVVLATSEGFSSSYATSSFSMSCSVLAGEGTAMERDYEYSSVRHYSDLTSPEEIGIIAAQRTLSRLNPRKVKTQQVPVIYAPRVSNGILGHLSGAISGAAVARGTSFLKDRLGKAVFAKGVNIIDDPHRRRGLRSKPFDGEGVANARRALVEDGVLTGWLLDTASARQLGLRSTGNAARSSSAAPSPSTSNFYMASGTRPAVELISSLKKGLFITEMIGMGVNPVTGDYSRGATGFWIEDGQFTYPVSEITVAGNLLDMFLHLTPGDDLQFRYGTDAPTLMIEGMTIAGE